MGHDQIIELVTLAVCSIVLSIVMVGFSLSIRQTAKLRGEWKRFADTIGATVEKKRFGGSKIVAPARQWTVTIDTGTSGRSKSGIPFTCLVIPYSPKRSFYFLLQARSDNTQGAPKTTQEATMRLLDATPTDKLSPDARACMELMVRGEEIPFSDADLDARYLLRATNRDLAQRLFAQPGIRRLLREQQVCTLVLKPPHMDKRLANQMPALECIAELSTAEALRGTYDLMVAVIEKMNRQNLAVPLPTDTAGDADRLLAGK
jgi:hypothetical protein